MPHALRARELRQLLSLAAASAAFSTPVLAQPAVLADETWQRPPAAIADAVMAPRHLNVSLSNASPDRRYFLRQESDGMPSMADFARPHVYLGGLQVDTRANRARSMTTRGSAGLAVISAETGSLQEIDVPNGARATNAQWSPDGSRVGFFAHYPDATHIYVADAATGRSRRVTRSPVLATLYTTFDWTTDGTGIIAVLVPDNRGPVPAEPVTPASPRVRITTSDKNPLRTYASLLETPHQMDLLEYYTTGQLARVDVASRSIRKIGAPAMIRSTDIGPRGEYIRVTTMHRPFSYIVPYGNFGTREELWSQDGRVITMLSERPLSDGAPADSADRAQRESDRRSLAWRPDGAGLSYLQLAPAAARDTATDAAADTTSADSATGSRASSRRKDRVMLWRAPYDSASTEVVYESSSRLGSVQYSSDGRILFITESGSGRAGSTQWAVYLDNPEKRYAVARQSSGDDAFYKDPGDLVTKPGPVTGQVVQLSSDGEHVFLRGTQYFENTAEQSPKMFIDKVAIRTGEKQRIYESDNDGVSERIVTVLDDDATRLIVVRESPTVVPDSWRRDPDGSLTRLTNNRDYTPEVTAAQRRRIEVTRADGFRFKVDVTLPRDWRPGTKLPAMFWFYPREFTDQESYDRTLRTHNRNAYNNVGVRSMDFLVLEGYAVVEPDAPIVGENGRMNDNYEADLRNSLAAVIDELDSQGMIDRNRLAAGGHSYGAFSTVNAMVHTPFFKAGIAGDGNYNRTLTPMAFQSERRFLWEAREVYLGMSPLLHANNLTGALLMYHGMADQNVGTDPINSTRLFHVLEGLGKTASLYMYPYEDHGPATEETVMDMWARWVSWLNTYVKNPQPAEKDEKVTTD